MTSSVIPLPKGIYLEIIGRIPSEDMEAISLNIMINVLPIIVVSVGKEEDLKLGFIKFVNSASTLLLKSGLNEIWERI